MISQKLTLNTVVLNLQQTMVKFKASSEEIIEAATFHVLDQN